MKLTFDKLMVGLVALGCFACDSGQAAPATDDVTATASASAKPAPEPDKPEEATITIVEKGNEPRSLLRYAPKPGQSERVKIRKATEDATVEGKDAEAPGAEFTIKLTFEKSQDDALVYAVVIDQVEIVGGPNAATKRAMQDTIGKAVGLKGSLTVSDRGLVREATLEIPDTMPDASKMAAQNLRDTLRESVFVVLPTARVGVGAKWERKHAVATAGMSVDRVMTFELVESADGKLRVKTTEKQAVKDQEMELGPGMKMTVHSLEASGTGEARVDLAHLAPVSVESSSSSTTLLQQGSRPKKEVKAKETNKITGGID